jgi:hypothetical protein
MQRSIWKTVLGGAAVALTLATQSPHAGATDTGAFTQYAEAVASDTAASLDSTRAANDNITCDPAAVVDGHMVNPRVGVVVGEVYAQAEIAAHWKCVSLDTGKTYWANGVVTDMYFSAGAYRTGTSANSGFVAATAGAATVNPFTLISYAGGSAALNTWHYAHFVGTTSTGRVIKTNSQLFYVAGV